MPTKKIADLYGNDDPPCSDPDTPPSMQAYGPGIWEHVCPGCGRKYIFRVEPGPTL